MDSSLFTAAIDALADAVLLLDGAGGLHYANPSARALLPDMPDSDSLQDHSVLDLCAPVTDDCGECRSNTDDRSSR